MRFPTLFLSLFIPFLFSCTTSVTQSDLQTRDKAKNIVSSSYPSEFPIFIGSFKNKSKNKEVDYLEQAIPDIIDGLLNPAKKENAYIDMNKFHPKIPDGLNQFFNSSNSLFSAYGKVTETTLTQISAHTVLETNVMMQNATNVYSYILKTNSLSTNFILSNKTVFNTEMYLQFITNEFPGLVDTLSYIPVSVNNLSRKTNSITNQGMFLLSLDGEFQAVSSKNGPNQVKITIHMKIQNDSTNSRDLFVNCREDEISEKLPTVLKDIRAAFLNRPHGDLILDTNPRDANIYLDGSYIGKSPLYYPALTKGTHSLVLLKEGYQQGRIQVQIVPDMTNLITSSINSWEKGGVLEVKSSPTNSQVFLDSLYVGQTPLTITNLELNKQHRLKILSDTSNLKPYYKEFYLRKIEENLRVKAVLKDYEGSSDVTKRNAWILTYTGWGLTVGIIGLNIYAHYQKEHFLDLRNVYGNVYDNQVNSFALLEQTSFTAGIISGILSGTLTAYALYTQQIYLGLKMDPFEPAAIIGIRF